MVFAEVASAAAGGNLWGCEDVRMREVRAVVGGAGGGGGVRVSSYSGIFSSPTAASSALRFGSRVCRLSWFRRAPLYVPLLLLLLRDLVHCLTACCLT